MEMETQASVGPQGNNGTAHTKPALELTVRMYKAMVRTRMLDERMTALQRQGRVGFHVGSMGEEAAIIGSAAALRDHDWIFPCYRELGALMWRGFPMQTYLHNMYGTEQDTVLGRQMPDHVTSKQYRFASISSPIGTQITQAVGFAWAAKLRKEDIVTAAYFGDGATSSNDFHAGMNFAGVHKIPTVFLCRNNQWAISVPTTLQTASSSFAKKAEAYGMPGVQCDGNNIVEVYRTVQQAVQKAASGLGPTLVELVTYRLGGHSTSDDPSAYRGGQEVERWSQQDPIARLRKDLGSAGVWTEQDESDLRQAIDAEIRQCIEVAEQTPKPALETLFQDVYAQMPPHLQEQHDECASGPRPRSSH
jgi:pyruvate dehydrogenase E1 component alpha subunit